MKDNLAYTVVGAIPELLRKYDEICGATFVNLYTLTKNKEIIAFKNFNPKNKEHLFLLGVAKGFAGAYHKALALDVSAFQLWKLNRGLDKDCRIVRLPKDKTEEAIIPEAILDFMRPKAVEACGEDFTFADIYNKYYNRKKGK